jgi:farnesyl diphosphate synthase
MERLDHFAKMHRTCIQVVDDVLTRKRRPPHSAKTAGKDAQHNKPTYVSVLGVSGRGSSPMGRL